MPARRHCWRLCVQSVERQSHNWHAASHDREGGTLLVFPEIGGKANGTLLGRRRVCELTDLRENGGDRSVMSGELVLDVRLELMKPPDKFLVRGQKLPQLQKARTT